MTTGHGAARRDQDVTSLQDLPVPADRVATFIPLPGPVAGDAVNKKLDGLARELGRQAARDFMSRGLSILEIAAALALAAVLIGFVLWLLR